MIAEQHNESNPGEPVSSPATSTSGGRRVILALAFVWPIVCMAASVVYCEKKVADVKANLGSRPPIAIIDVNGDAMRMIESNPGLSGEEAAAKVYQKGAKLAEAGFVVLHKADLVAYPAEFEVKQ